MNKYLYFAFIATLFFLTACSDSDNDSESNIEESESKSLNSIQSKEAFNYLNAVRNNPGSYSDELGVNLSAVEKRDNLIWNDILAKAAYEKAKDMAERNYFDHVDLDGYGMNYMINEAGFELADYLLSSKTDNSFESIAAGTNRNSGKIMVQQLIIDKGVSSLGHRKHLLGMTDFWAKSPYCGIGFYKKEGSRYRYYMCVLIARHE